MANLSKLSETANTKYAEVVNDADSSATGINPEHLKTLIHNIFTKVDESLDKTNEHIGKVISMQSEINTEKSKTGITNTQRDAIIANTAKEGITTSQKNAISVNTAKEGITTAQKNAISANTAKTGITTSQANAIVANTAKTGITTTQANAITANTAKTGITTSQANAITANTAKVGITSEQIKAISVNTAKVGITTEQARAITINSRKTGLQVGSQVKGFEIVDSIFLLIPGRNLGEFSLRIQMMVENRELGKSQAQYIDLPLQPGKGK